VSKDPGYRLEAALNRLTACCAGREPGDSPMWQTAGDVVQIVGAQAADELATFINAQINDWERRQGN